MIKFFICDNLSFGGRGYCLTSSTNQERCIKHGRLYMDSITAESREDARKRINAEIERAYR